MRAQVQLQALVRQQEQAQQPVAGRARDQPPAEARQKNWEQRAKRAPTDGWTEQPLHLMPRPLPAHVQMPRQTEAALPVLARAPCQAVHQWTRILPPVHQN